MIKLDSAFIITISVSLLLGFPHPGKSEIEDPIPSLPRGDVSIHLSSFTTGMPVQEEFITPVFTQRVGPTDLAEIPNGSGSLIVTNYGGVAFRLDQSGLVAPRAFLNLSSPESPSFNSAFEFGGAHGLTTIAFHPGFSDITSQGYRKFYTVEPETSGSGVPGRSSRAITIKKRSMNTHWNRSNRTTAHLRARRANANCCESSNQAGITTWPIYCLIPRVSFTSHPQMEMWPVAHHR